MTVQSFARALVASMAAAACLGAASADEPGIGAHPGAPSGAAYHLPAGIELVGDITGSLDSPCPNVEGATYLGSIGGGQAVVCVRFRNRTSSPVKIEFPKAMMITSAAHTYQNGLLISRTAVQGPAELVDLTVCPQEDVVVKIMAHCVNPDRGYPEGDGVFRLGPVSDSAAMRALAEAGHDREVTFDQTEMFMELIKDGASAEELAEELRSIRAAPPARTPAPRRCPPTARG